MVSMIYRSPLCPRRKRKPSSIPAKPPCAAPFPAPPVFVPYAFAPFGASGRRRNRSRTLKFTRNETRSSAITHSSPPKAKRAEARTGAITVTRFEEKESIPLACPSFSFGTSMPTAMDCAGD